MVNEQVLHLSVSSVLHVVSFMCFFHVRFSLLCVATIAHKQIERMKRKLSDIEFENAQYKAHLEEGVAQAEEQKRTIQNKLLVIEALQKRFSDQEEVHIATLGTQVRALLSEG